MNTDNQWSKQEACFERATLVWLTVNHIISVSSDEWRSSSDKVYIFPSWHDYKHPISNCPTDFKIGVVDMITNTQFQIVLLILKLV